MKRRDFIGLSGAGLLYTGLNGFTLHGSKSELLWKKVKGSKLFSQLYFEGSPLVLSGELGALNVSCRTIEKSGSGETVFLNPENEQLRTGALRFHLQHKLKNTYSGMGEDILEAILTVNNKGGNAVELDICFTSALQPSAKIDQQKIYIPISAAGLNRDNRLDELGSADFYQECEQAIGQNDFACHYLEPMASNPTLRKTKALLLAPVVDIQNPASALRIALMTPSEEPYQFSTCKDSTRQIGWQAQRRVKVLPGSELKLSCWLFCHKGEADKAWDVFHKLAHHDEFESPEWMKEVKVHYYDFLSSANGESGLRGDGYEADIPFFKEFNVGLATQHGYYPFCGDFISHGRENWLAMQGDKMGAAKMSIQKMKDRIDATRRTGSKAAIYMHTVLFDDASPVFDSLKESILIDEKGEKKLFSWKGPDTVQQNWWMSFASPDWTNHLLKQAEQIMETWNPDAIVFDETFVCLGYEHHTSRQGALSPHSIKFFKDLRRLVHSYGNDKAVLTSDCGMSNMVMWADGEAGDHAYPTLLGHSLYRKEPIRYKAALGQKPWIPCAWNFSKMWNEQMDLARKSNTGVGVANGYIEFNGLKNLPENIAVKIKNDIQSLF
jgi:hypothetical protein